MGRLGISRIHPGKFPTDRAIPGAIRGFPPGAQKPLKNEGAEGRLLWLVALPRAKGWPQPGVSSSKNAPPYESNRETAGLYSSYPAPSRNQAERASEVLYNVRISKTPDGHPFHC